MIVQVHIEPNSYFDSVVLMAVAATLNRLPGVDVAALLMGTGANIELLRDSGLWDPTLPEVSPNDLIVAVRATDEATANQAIQEALQQLRASAAFRPTEGPRHAARSLRMALREASPTAVVAISVPGPYAPIEAEEALRSGHNVFLFSDNVPLQEEIRLKKLARESGLLLMGPDSGTASLSGLGLGFMDAVRRGPIGIIAAAGTGLQQVASLIDWLGSGISHGIGTGGRDLDAQVGGITMLTGLELLAEDPETSVIVLVSKHPAPEIADKVLKQAASCGKPVVATFIGSAPAPIDGIHPAANLTEAAQLAVHLATGRPLSDLHLEGKEDVEKRVLDARARLAPQQRFLRGLYSGGTLCDEAMAILTPHIGSIWSNIPLDPRLRLPNLYQSKAHTFIDLGADEFTIGRPHPMIDQTIRIERLQHEAEDPEVAAILFDVVLGYGAASDPAGQLAPIVHELRNQTERNGRSLTFLVALIGTTSDPQNYDYQRRLLQEAGALVVPSNAWIAELATRLVA